MKKFLRMIPLILVYMAIIYFSVKRPSGNTSLFKHMDKVYHFVAYLTLGLTIFISTINNRSRIILIIISLGLGISIEFIQGMLSYRDMSLLDGITNIIGLFSGVALFNVVYKHKREN